MPQKHYERVTTKNTLNRVREEKMPFDWSINPYRGCAHGCSFCYARAFQGFIGLDADDFQNRIRIKDNAAEALEDQLARLLRRFHGDADALRRHIGLVAIGTATDPYQPVEGKEQITRQCLQVLARYHIPVTVTTRSPLILRDLDLLKTMPVESVNISINTLDPMITRKLEPATSFPMKRMETVRQLNENGIPAGIFIAPIMPYITDDLAGIERLLQTARNHQAAFAMPSMLRLSADVKHWFFQTLKKHFPELIAKYARLYTSKYASRAYSEPFMKQVRELVARYGLDKTSVTDTGSASQTMDIAQESVPEQLAFLF